MTTLKVGETHSVQFLNYPTTVQIESITRNNNTGKVLVRYRYPDHPSSLFHNTVTAIQFLDAMERAAKYVDPYEELQEITVSSKTEQSRPKGFTLKNLLNGSHQ